MKRFPLLLMFMALPALADEYRGSITSTEAVSRNNATTTHANGTFTLRAGARYAIQCDIASYVRTTSSAGTGAVTTDRRVEALAFSEVPLASSRNHTLLWTRAVAT